MFVYSSRAKISALSALFCVLLHYDASFGASKHQNVYDYYEFGDIRDESLNSQLDLAQKGDVDAMANDRITGGVELFVLDETFTP